MTTVNISLTDSFGRVLQTDILFRPIQPLKVSRYLLSIGGLQSISTNELGQATINLYAGKYDVYILTTKFQIMVPESTTPVNISDLIPALNQNQIIATETYYILTEAGGRLVTPAGQILIFR